MPGNRPSNIALGLAASFTTLASVTFVLLATKVVSLQMGTLMLVALVGLHLGFGILIAVYRMLGKLE